MKETRLNIDFAEIIRSLTPVSLAIIGGAIGISALFFIESDHKVTSAMGLAGTCIAGASGLAQSSPKSQKSKTDSSDSL